MDLNSLFSSLMEVFAAIEDHVVLPYILTVLFAGYLITNLLEKQKIELRIKKWYVPKVYLILAIATVLAVAFWILFSQPGYKYVLSYFMVTSLHEVFTKWIERRVKIFLNGNDTPTTRPDEI